MNALPSIAVVLVLVALCWAIVLLQKVTRDHSRFLVGMIGLMATFHGLRQLKYMNVAPPEMAEIGGQVADVLVAILLFIALVILDGEVASHQSAKIQLRLSQALEPPAPAFNGTVLAQAVGAPVPEPPVAGLPQDHTLRRLIDGAPVAIVGLDQERRVIMTNAAAAKLFGLDREELIGKNLAAAGSKPACEAGNGRSASSISA